MFVYFNGQVIEDNEAKISIFDHGYLYGLGLFETFAVYDGHPFLLDDHFKRLQKGLHELGIDWTYNKEKVMSILRELMVSNGLKDAYIRWNVSAGVKPVGVFDETYSEPSVSAFAKPLPQSSNKPRKVEILDIRRNTPEGKQRMKSFHYMNNLLAKRELLDRNSSAEGLFLTGDGYLAEGIVTNLFFVKNHVVHTPSIETGILDGVTRRFLISLLKKAHVKVEEGFYTVDDLKGANEAFITNSIQELIPIELDGVDLEMEGKYFTYLKKEYQHFKHFLWSRDEI
ncbi:4-amino-4-deoxychorismate lyase [Bacillus sp. TS-2]|nr:4-amino-4-deoxychorismate lyase [Bacillus sp. TS-2]